jgi:hypothetical protein
MIPIRLKGYHFIDELMKWREGSVIVQKREWTIRNGYGGWIECRLQWHVDGQRYSVVQCAPSAEESVWRSLEEFQEWERRQ